MQTHVAFPRLRLPSFQLRKVAATECPHLGLAADPFARHPRPSDEHRCYAHLGRERIDLGHQRRFCLASAHGGCPFLLVNPRAETRDWRSRAGALRRHVSPADMALTAAQLGYLAGLGAAAARTYGALALAVCISMAQRLGALVLQTWSAVRPGPKPVEFASAEFASAEEHLAASPTAAEPIATASR